MIKPFIKLLIICLAYQSTFSQVDASQTPPNKINNTQHGFNDSFSIRGYAQVRYNRLLETNENLGCEQCDKSWGKGGGFFIRRTRIIFSGQILHSYVTFTSISVLILKTTSVLELDKVKYHMVSKICNPAKTEFHSTAVMQ